MALHVGCVTATKAGARVVTALRYQDTLWMNVSVCTRRRTHSLKPAANGLTALSFIAIRTSSCYEHVANLTIGTLGVPVYAAQ
jgi:hypothetical protein